MLHFTILRHSRQLRYCPFVNGEMLEDRPSMATHFYSTEAIVAQDSDGITRLFHIVELTDESEATVSGYMVEGEDQL